MPLDLLLDFIRYAVQFAGVLKAIGAYIDLVNSVVTLAVNVTVLLVAWGFARDRAEQRQK